MISLLVFIISILLLVITVVNLLLKSQAKKFSEYIASSSIIIVDLEQKFQDHIITASEKKAFISLHEDDYKHAARLSKWLCRFRVSAPEEIVTLISDYESIDSIVKQHNEQVEKNILTLNATFFDSCLKYPLDLQQRRSIIAEENNVLVVSSAGSGKTSSIVGKVKYLTEIKNVNPEKILLISYTHKAATELTERAGVNGLCGYTFHKLSLDILGKTTGEKPSICDNTDVLFVNIYKKLLKSKNFQESLLGYFADYDQDIEEWEKGKKEKQQQLAETKKNIIKALFPDMDGNVVYVRSAQEKKICFALTSLGVKFRYEEPYEYPLADEAHSQYRPDFSIHYVKDGKQCRLYLEHFGVDEHHLVPVWFAKDKGITYEEANKRYNDGITWKIAAHKKFGTKMVYTSSADFRTKDIKEKLKMLFKDAGVPFHEMTDEELYMSVLPSGSKQEKTFIRLIVTFINLLKSRCETIYSVLQKAKEANDQRSVFVIENIFKPVYVEYTRELERRKQIDFTDAILMATKLCNERHPVSYDYIIVDEFQDISIDRYRFLQALRGGEKMAKLFCVGDDWQSIYRFSGSDVALFSKFPDYFGATDIRRIEATYRFGEPLLSLTSHFIQRNGVQLKKTIHPFNKTTKTELFFQEYDQLQYVDILERVINGIPRDKSVFLLGRYSFDDYYLSFRYKCIKDNNNFYYEIGKRRIEFLTVHKSKGLEADYVILLQCNKGTFGFPSQINDDPVLQYVLSGADQYPYGEERRLFYVAITRAKAKTIVMYDKRYPSVFVDEFLHPETVTAESYLLHPNANKRWTREADKYLLDLHNQGKSVRYIANKMGRSQTSIIFRLGKLGVD